MAEPILFLCCMQMMCLVKLFSILHVHFMFEPLLCAPGLAAFHFLDVSALDACTAICLTAVSRQPTREQLTLK